MMLVSAKYSLVKPSEGLFRTRKEQLGAVRSTSMSNEDRSSSFRSLKLLNSQAGQPSEDPKFLFSMFSKTKLHINCSCSKGYIYFIFLEIQFKTQKAIT